MTTPDPLERRKHRVLMWMTLAVIANAVFDVIVGLPHDQPGFAVFATTGVAAFFAVAWVRLDGLQRKVKLGAWGPAVLFLTKVALPAYFVLSRGWKRGLLATLSMFALVAGLLALYGLSARLTAALMGL